MKKVLFAVASLVLGFGAIAQTPTIVSTEKQKRNAVIEEYTGVNCQYCPDGHKRVQEFADANPGRVVPINIHVGGYAVRYTTQWGSAIEGQTDLQGYPAGSVNRNVTNCKVHAYNRGEWASVGGGILNEDSPVNVAATATIDAQTREVKVHVEAYYTSDLEQPFNMLNVVLLQSHILGPQIGATTWNPGQMVGDQYSHNHMFRDMITGKQWGDTVAKNDEGLITAGTFVEKDYTYQLPEVISDEAVVLGDLDIAVFITDGENKNCTSLKAPNIWTGIVFEPTYINMDGANFAYSNVTFTPEAGCGNLANISFDIRNIAGDTLKSIKFEYSNEATNDTKTYTWEGEVITFKSATIAFEEPITVTTGQEATVTIKVTEINGNTPENAIETSAKYTKPLPKEGNGIPKLVLRTDKKAGELTWFVYNSEGEVLQQGGGYANGSVVRDTVELTSIDKIGCYTFEIKDEGKDGCDGCQYKIMDPAKKSIVSNTKGNWGAGEMADFKIIDFITVGLNEANENIFQSIVYPNPAKDMATLSVNLGVADNANITVVDLTGRTVVDLGSQSLRSGENQIQINTSNLESGLYYIRVTTDNGMTTNKLNVIK